ncbi:unnamed protein product [Prorocentrum cordatum]|uniref:Uncharacterized protein n=1 Tax=Prorocentrum cordatum TaxID=2364126 RepID=A0ABN9UIL3_9DINO|nr:unnamed protein product [Polarella glacialis]
MGEGLAVAAPERPEFSAGCLARHSCQGVWYLASSLLEPPFQSSGIYMPSPYLRFRRLRHVAADCKMGVRIVAKGAGGHRIFYPINVWYVAECACSTRSIPPPQVVLQGLPL